MTITMSAAARTAQADSVLDLLDAGSLLRVYTGTKPATPETAATGTLLLELELNDPAGTVASGVLTLSATPTISAAAVADGTVGWARVLDGSAVAVFDGTVSAIGGGGDFQVSDASLETAQVVTLASGTLTWGA